MRRASTISFTFLALSRPGIPRPPRSSARNAYTSRALIEPPSTAISLAVIALSISTIVSTGARSCSTACARPSDVMKYARLGIRSTMNCTGASRTLLRSFWIPLITHAANSASDSIAATAFLSFSISIPSISATGITNLS